MSDSVSASTSLTTTTLPSIAVPSEKAPEQAWLQFVDPGAIPLSLAVLVGGMVVARLMDRLADRLSERTVTYRLLIKNVGTIVRLSILFASGAWSILNLFVINSQALFAFAGTLGVLVGFALKDVMNNLLAGASIVLNRAFQVGDRVSFGGYYGEVKSIGISKVKLQTLDDNLVTIPAVKIGEDIVANANAGALDCMVVVHFAIDAAADHEKAMQMVREAVFVSRYVALHRPVVVLVAPKLLEGLGTYLEVTAKAYVYDARFEKQFASDITDRVICAFRKHGVRLATISRKADS